MAGTHRGGGSRAGQGGQDARSGSGGAALATKEQRELLECPICMELMFPPILQCRNGHPCCSKCRPKLGSECPSCKVDLTDMSRTLPLEKMAETLQWACKHEGCGENFAYAALKSHNTHCRYAPYRCPLGSCGAVGTLPTISQHLQNTHKATLASNLWHQRFYATEEKFPEGLSQHFGGDKEDRVWPPVLITCYGEEFLVTVAKYSSVPCKMMAVSVFFLGDDEDALNFSCTVEVTGGGGKVSREAPPNSIRKITPKTHLVFLRDDTFAVESNDSPTEEISCAFMFDVCVHVQKRAAYG